MTKNDTPRYFPIMVRQSFQGRYTGSVSTLMENLRDIGVTNLVLQVPWAMMIEHEAQAQKNHSQSIKRLAERGGLGADEACAVLQDRAWRTMDYAGANSVLISMVRQWLRERQIKITEATDEQIAHMKRFWEETPDQPQQRLLTASLLKKDFLSLIERLERTEAALSEAPAKTEPAAWLHTLHMECDQKSRRLSFDDGNAFGVPGRDYSEEYEVTIEPLFSQARKETTNAAGR